MNISKINVKNSNDDVSIAKKVKERNSIIKALSSDKKNIILPAKELYLRVDLNGNHQNIILYQMILDNLNEYKLFGIEQILKLNNIKYSIIKSNEDLKLFINFTQKSQADKLRELFKEYNFKVELKKIKLKEKE